MTQIVIVGNGIAGVTAARHIRKLSDFKITIISSESKYFFSRTALMYVYMGHMKFEHTEPYEPWFWEKNRIDLVQDTVVSVEVEEKKIKLESGQTLKYDKLIIATGSKSNKFGWPGQDLEGVLGMYHKQDLDNLEKWAPNNSICKRAVVVGGGLIGIELVEMLLSRQIPVTFLVREASFWSGVLPSEDSALITNHIKSHHVDIRLSSSLAEIVDDGTGKVQAVTIKETGEVIPCQVVGLTAGVSPNVDFLKTSSIEVKRGVVVNTFLETNIEDVYAIGDCAEQRVAIGERRSIEAVWYTGRMMGRQLHKQFVVRKKHTNRVIGLIRPNLWA
jgi:NAD(P)H-nitrite reductase large subunit